MSTLRNAMMARRMATKPGAEGAAAFRTQGPMMMTPGGLVGAVRPMRDQWMQDSWGGRQPTGQSVAPYPHRNPRTATLPAGGGAPIISHAPMGGGMQPTGQSYTPAPPVPLVGTIPPGGGPPVVSHAPAAGGMGGPMAGGMGGMGGMGWQPQSGGGGSGEIHPALAQAMQARASRQPAVTRNRFNP